MNVKGIKGFLSEKSQQVKNLAGKMSDRLHYLVSPQDRPEVVRVKIKEVSDELAASSQHHKTTLAEATKFLQDKREDLQHSVSGTGKRMKSALDSAWKKLNHQ